MVTSNLKKPGKGMSRADAQKILSEVSYDKGFHFFMTDGHYTGETAISLSTFSKELVSVDIQSVRYHFDRGDFQKWIRTMIGDDELANRIDDLAKICPTEEALQKNLNEVVAKRLRELKSLSESVASYY